MSEFTGERVIPGEVEVDLWNEHVSRYALARRYAAGTRALDIGCGTGYGAADLSRTATSVVGIDLAEEAIRYAREHYPIPNVTFLQASATELPFISESFDLVTTFEVIEHLENWRELLGEMRRVVRREGLAIISTPNRAYYAETRRLEGPNPFHHHEFDAEEFVSELRAYFPHVSLLLQNRTEALTFYPDRTFAQTVADIESGGGCASDAHFFLAFCSVAPHQTAGAFVFVPRAANILREREQHIALLEQELEMKNAWLAEARQQRDKLQEELDQQNRWALGLDEELKAARARIVQLQDEVAEMRSGYEAKIQELERQDAEKTEWALRLNAEVEALRDGYSRLESQLVMVRTSRWVRLGRQFGLGPPI